MHEHGMIKGIIQKIESIARSNNAEKVKSIKIRLGALSHTTPVHFREHFEPLAAGTAAGEADIEFIVSDDIDDENASNIILESVEIEE